MFKDQKEYLLLTYITSDLICFTIVYWLFMPLFLKLTGLFPPEFSVLTVPKNHLYLNGRYLKLFPAFIFTLFLFMLVFRGYKETGVRKISTILYKTGIICLAYIPALFFFKTIPAVLLKKGAY